MHTTSAHLLERDNKLLVLAPLGAERLAHAALPRRDVLRTNPSNLRRPKEDHGRVLTALVRDSSQVLPCSGLGEDLRWPA
jgi:hypothetical protein